MNSSELARTIVDHLIEIGSTNAKIISDLETSILFGATGATFGVSASDIDIYDAYDNDPLLSEMSRGSGEVFALPYGKHLILIFDTKGG